MDSLTDQQLLRDYADSRSEAAFAELVRRHVDLVHSAAVRMVCDAHLAEDVTQGVFVALAQDARQLVKHPVLAGWLHRTAQNIAAQTVRTDVRRRAREQEAAAMNEPLATETEPTWQQIAPQLDSTLGELSPTDRDVLLLRYFQRKSAEEIAQNLGISSEAAQKRVTRAVERLRELFDKRGVTIGAGGLVAVVSVNAVTAAPAGLAATISATAGLAGTTIATTTITKTITMTALQKTLVAAVIAAAVSTGIYEAREASRMRNQVRILEQQQASLKAQLESKGATNGIAPTNNQDAQWNAAKNLAELLKLRGKVGVLREQLESANKTNSRGNAIANLVNDPAQKELSRIEFQKTLKSRYASLIKTLNLAPDTVDKLFSILTDNELSKKDRLAALVRGDMDVTGALQDRENAKQQMIQQIQSLIGEDGYAQFFQFNHDSEANSTVKDINTQLGGLALNDGQSQSLHDLLIAQPDVTVDEADLFRSKESLDGIYQTGFDRAQTMLQQASGFLTPEQTAALGAINSNYWNDIRTKLTLNQQLINSALGRSN